MSKICGNCGSAVPEEAKFCTECGGSEFELQQAAGGPSPDGLGMTGAPAQPYAQPAYGAAAPKKSKKGLIVAIIAIVLALGLAAVAAFVWPGFLSGKSSPIDGEWLGEYGETMIIGDGRITIDHGEYGKNVYEMTLDGENLELTQLSEMTYKIEGDTLTLTVLNQGERVEIVADRVSGSGGIEGEWGNLRVVDEDGESQSIGGSTMEFRSDGTYVSKQSYSDDINGTYEVSGDRITVRNTNDKINFVYTLEGDTLTFWEKNEAGELEEVEKFTRKGANGGSEMFGGGEVDTALLGEWIEEEGDLFLVFNSDGTGTVSDDDDDSAFTYRLNGENITVVREGVTYNYTYEILNGALYFYDGDGEIDDVFYREGALPARGYTGASVGGEWKFDVSGVDYGDMYDAMMGAAYDASGASETVRRIMQDARYKEALREPITDLLNDYEFDFRSDGSVYITVDTDDYIKFMAKTTEAMIPLLRALTIEEAADYYGISVAELEQYLANNGLTWDQHVDGIASTYSEVNAEFDEYSVAEVLGGTLNAYGDVELYAGSFTQNGDQVTMTGEAGDVTVFVFSDDYTLLLDGVTGSESEMAMFRAMEGLKFVR